MTRVRFVVAAPQGEIVPDAADLALALEGNPDGVTYGEYFAALADFLQGEAGAALAQMAAAALGGPLPAPAAMSIRAEKHGALYHPASVELSYPDGRTFRGGVLAAGTALARAVLANEATWMNRLREHLGEPLLPRVLAATAAEGDGPLALALVEWFAGFCEFHVDAAGVVQLWDFGRGLVPLSPAQVRELYGRAGYILGRCYDPASGGRVFPWHHAAGDFVARLENGRLDVRLTTVRDFGPAQDAGDGPANPLASLAGFVLETTLRLRLGCPGSALEWAGAEAGPDAEQP